MGWVVVVMGDEGVIEEIAEEPLALVQRSTFYARDHSGPGTCLSCRHVSKDSFAILKHMNRESSSRHHQFTGSLQLSPYTQDPPDTRSQPPDFPGHLLPPQLPFT